MKAGLTAATLLPLFAAVLYLAAGQWVAVRVRRQEEKADRLLFRAVHRSGIALAGATAAAFGTVHVTRDEIGTASATALIYLLPLFWLFAGAAGRSWLELRAGRSDSGFAAYARFNLFEAFLLGGQRLPLLSAAFAMPADVSRGTAILPGVALHVSLAIALGLLVRWFVVYRVARIRPFPDPALVAEVEAVAGQTGARLRGIRLVPTERGQSVNAVAATSSSVIYVAQGLVEGLEPEELKAVLLHELGHFRQPFTNRFRNLAGLAIPGLVWLCRAREGFGLSTLSQVSGTCLLLLAAVGGWLLAGRLYSGAEIRADRFAEDWGEPGALGRALRKIYAMSSSRTSWSPRPLRNPDLTERLAELDRASGRSRAVST